MYMEESAFLSMRQGNETSKQKLVDRSFNSSSPKKCQIKKITCILYTVYIIFRIYHVLCIIFHVLYPVYMYVSYSSYHILYICIIFHVPCPACIIFLVPYPVFRTITFYIFLFTNTLSKGNVLYNVTATGNYIYN